ncbi:MAG: hypothetical protein ACLFR2_12095 [Candidatus Kapaibacterium sp.]
MKYKHNMKIIITVVILFAALSCSTEKTERKFVEVYKDIIIAREMISDSTKANKVVDSILNSHGMNEAEFRQKYFELSSDRKKFVKMIDSARALANKEIERIKYEANDSGDDIRKDTLKD